MRKNILSLLLSGAALTLVSATFATSSHAANITLQSMHYSTDHMVPHFLYDGPTETGDTEKLAALFRENVHCGIECSPPEGQPTAVLQMNGPGGDYQEGLKLAEFLRANSIATVVERGSFCASACAFSFLGGSGYSSQSGIGPYVDRVAEPGSTVGFHAPYLTEDTLMQFIEDLGSDVVMDGNRANYAIMVDELVKWNIDPNIIGWMVFQGPDQTYNLHTANDLFLTRTALPNSPTTAWIEDKPNAIRNACLRLMAEFHATDPVLEQDFMPMEMVENTGVNEFGEQLMGFQISNELLRLGHCSVTQSSYESDGDFDIALYMTAGIDGTSTPLLSFSNRQNGWSTLGIGAEPTRRIFQKGSMNHVFLDPGVILDDLDENAMLALANRRFTTISPSEPPLVAAPVTIEYQNANVLIARSGNVRVFAQSGGVNLYDAALEQLGAQGVTITSESASDFGFVRSGTYASGHPFAWFGFRDENVGSVIRVESIAPTGEPWTEDEAALVRQIQCTTAWEGYQLQCG